uniref:Uncharacterized protein n=1 Tax=Romanomermis culicivorax TaxID=13658 RepID=A0A915K2V4_ROMCU
MNRIPKREPAFDHESGTYICNHFALHLVIFDQDFHMETAIEEIEIDETDYMANLHSWFHFYSRLLGIIDFQNRFTFPTPIYTYPLLTTASAHVLTAEELLERPMLPTGPEPSEDQLLEMLIFDLNMAKLPTAALQPAPRELPAAADLTVSATQINEFLKLMLDDISSLAPAPLEESTPLNQLKWTLRRTPPPRTKR